MKHVGKMKNNSARVAVVFRTLPGDPYSALVVGTQGLSDAYHDSLMTLLQEDSAQSANELADILSVRKFPDGNNMLEWLHVKGHLKKVPTKLVLMTPTPQQSIQLDELNNLIAEQKGLSLEDLSVNDGARPNANKSKKESNSSAIVETSEKSEPLTASEMRSKADALFKQAQQLRKKADELDPPKKKTKQTPVISAE